VAFEGCVRDAETSRVIATVAGRRETRTRPAAEIGGEWSRQLMEATNKDL